MYLIAGLGNPEQKYEKTRHNIGFRILDALAARYRIDIKEKKHKGQMGTGTVAGEKVILIKPTTYMNLSGDCVYEAAAYYKIPPEKVIVVFDDISLEPGKLRVRKKGSSGGHNGIKSIIARLGTENFPRLKFGVGDKPEGTDLVEHVLGRFTPAEEALVESGIARACDAVCCMIEKGYDAAMNQYN